MCDKCVETHTSQQRQGIEYPTEVGPVDILALDDEGNFVVFELKLTMGPDKTIGQLLRYMGWIKANLAKDHNVYGVMVAKEVHEKLRYAALLVPSLFRLLEYEVDFRLQAAELRQIRQRGIREVPKVLFERRHRMPKLACSKTVSKQPPVND
jgi:hypothetical protein